MSRQLSHELGALDGLLRSSAEAFEFPRTPDIAAGVRTRTAGLEPRRRLLDAMSEALAQPLYRVAAVALLVMAVVAASAVAIPQSREALADFFGLSKVSVEIGPVLGPDAPILSPSSFARPATTATAQAAADFELQFPMRDGARLLPGQVYIQGFDIGLAVVIFVYQDEAFDLYQSRRGFFGKEGEPENVRETAVGGERAIWLDEGGHVASFLDEQGKVMVETRRSIDRATLLWERDGVTYRLETSLSEAEGIRVAESLR